MMISLIKWLKDNFCSITSKEFREFPKLMPRTNSSVTPKEEIHGLQPCNFHHCFYSPLYIHYLPSLLPMSSLKAKNFRHNQLTKLHGSLHNHSYRNKLHSYRDSIHHYKQKQQLGPLEGNLWLYHQKYLDKNLQFLLPSRAFSLSKFHHSEAMENMSIVTLRELLLLLCPRHFLYSHHHNHYQEYIQQNIVLKYQRIYFAVFYWPIAIQNRQLLQMPNKSHMSLDL